MLYFSHCVQNETLMSATVKFWLRAQITKAYHSPFPSSIFDPNIIFPSLFSNTLIYCQCWSSGDGVWTCWKIPTIKSNTLPPSSGVSLLGCETSALKMGVSKFTRRYNREYQHWHIQRRKNFKFINRFFLWRETPISPILPFIILYYISESWKDIRETDDTITHDNFHKRMTWKIPQAGWDHCSQKQDS